jgi:hypothetical protein
MSSWSQVPTFKRLPDGTPYVNDEKDYIRPFELPMDKPNAIVTLAASTRVGPFPLTAKQDGPIEIFYVKVVVYDGSDAVVTDYNIDFLLEHAGKKKIFSNRDVPLIACAGDGGRPYVLPESIFLPAVQSMQVTFNNKDSATRKVEFVLGGIKYYTAVAPSKTKAELIDYAQRRDRTYAYWMTTDAAVSLTALETGFDAFFTIPDDTDLEVLKLTARSDGEFRASMKDAEKDRSITGGAKIHSSILFGGHNPTAVGGGVGGSGGVWPARWATSLLVRRSTKLEINIDDLSNDVNTVQVVLGGRKISYAS